MPRCGARGTSGVGELGRDHASHGSPGLAGVDRVAGHAARTEHAGRRAALGGKLGHVAARGIEVRRAMWGFEGADGQINAAGDFIWPLQEVVTKYCFGQTWTRPRLSRKVRSMITMAMLVAMARPHELKVHVQGAIANGVTKEEIQEILLHAMVYAGVPRGVEGFRAAEEKLKEMGLG